MQPCAKCGEDFYGYKCKCGFSIKKQEKEAPNFYRKQEDKKCLYGVDVVAQECKQLISDRLDNKIDSFELAEKMFELDKRYPGIGFDVQAKKVLNSWEKRNENKTGND